MRGIYREKMPFLFSGVLSPLHTTLMTISKKVKLSLFLSWPMIHYIVCPNIWGRDERNQFQLV